jgi:hypothetical protein
MVGLLKNSSNLISRTNVCMQAGEDIWEIRQIMIGNGTRVAKEVTMGMMMTRGLATMAVMELVAKTRVTMGPVMSQAMMMTNDDRTDDYSDYNGASGLDGAGGYDRASDDKAEDGLEYYSDE